MRMVSPSVAEMLHAGGGAASASDEAGRCRCCRHAAMVLADPYTIAAVRIYTTGAAAVTACSTLDKAAVAAVTNVAGTLAPSLQS
jgi:hypothetical protein